MRTSAKEKQVGSTGSLFRNHHKEGAASTRKGLEEKGVASFNSHQHSVCACACQDPKRMLGYGQL